MFRQQVVFATVVFSRSTSGVCRLLAKFVHGITSVHKFCDGRSAPRCPTLFLRKNFFSGFNLPLYHTLVEQSKDNLERYASRLIQDGYRCTVAMLREDHNATPHLLLLDEKKALQALSDQRKKDLKSSGTLSENSDLSSLSSDESDDSEKGRDTKRRKQDSSFKPVVFVFESQHASFEKSEMDGAVLSSVLRAKMSLAECEEVISGAFFQPNANSFQLSKHSVYTEGNKSYLLAACCTIIAFMSYDSELMLDDKSFFNSQYAFNTFINYQQASLKLSESARESVSLY